MKFSLINIVCDERCRSSIRLPSLGRSALVLVFFFLSSRMLYAQLSPGDLHQAHANLEGVTNCTRCHESGQRLNPQKCLDCHVLLSEQIQKNKGLHSRPEYRQCADCHVEHQGKTYDLIFWKNGQEKFDHAQTGYVLVGKHLGIECRRCHNIEHLAGADRFRENKIDLNRTYLGLTQDCLTCHHDEHRGQLRRLCLDCHVMTGWKPAAKFDHSRSAFSLTGRHQTVACEKCHHKIADHKFPKDSDFLQFSQLKHADCSNCHQDVHQNRFGELCSGCHSASGWKSVALHAFNHNQTNYPLKGLHAAVKCERCHLPGKPLKIARYSACQDCHADYHQSQFYARQQQGACEECHTVQGFTPAMFTINEHQKTKYPLNGGHLAIPCFLCHKKIKIGKGGQTLQFRFKSTRCSACHSDAHHGEADAYLEKISPLTNQDGCEHCHITGSWATILFDHFQTKFPLDGKHQTAACSQCHKSTTDRDSKTRLQLKRISSSCQDCHPDIHLSQFKTVGEERTLCQRCHTPKNWQAEKFHHDRDAKFKLEGAHQKVKCEHCHSPVIEDGRTFVRYKPLDGSCKSCHGGTKGEEP